MSEHERFRLFGGETDADVGFYDMEVAAVEPGGEVYLDRIDYDGIRYGFGVQELAHLANTGLLVPLDQVNTDDPEWETVSELAERAAESDSEHLEEAARRVFKHLA